MRTATLLSALGVLAMTGVLVYGFSVGNFLSEGAVLTSMPWGIVSLVDLYTGFVLFSGWIVFRERSLPVALLWVAAMMTLGFLAGSAYALLAARGSGGDWRRFWLGKRA